MPDWSRQPPEDRHANIPANQTGPRGKDIGNFVLSKALALSGNSSHWDDNHKKVFNVLCSIAPFLISHALHFQS